LHENGEWNAIETLQDLHIFRSSGFDLLEHLHFGLVEPPNSRSEVAAHVDRVRDCVRRHFSVA